MYIRFSAFLPIVALTAVATAAPTELEARNFNQCNMGSVQCCNNAYAQSDSILTSVLGLLGVVLPEVGGLVGLGCTPITVIGPGGGNGIGASCTQQPVCCNGNTYNGLINIGCSPINL